MEHDLAGFIALIYENFIPEEDDCVVKRLRDAGCVILGKTNLPEFGFIGVTHNKVFGTTRNPWNLERTPEGSLNNLEKRGVTIIK